MPIVDGLATSPSRRSTTRLAAARWSNPAPTAEPATSTRRLSLGSVRTWFTRLPTRLILAMILMSLSGCAMVEERGAEAVDAISEANDLKLEAAVLVVCRGAYGAIKRRWGDDPEAMRHWAGLCRHGTYPE